MEAWISTYGYAGLLFGAFLDSPTVLVLGGFAVARDYLAPGPAFAAATVGAFLSGYTKFAVARRFGPGLLARRPAWRARAERLDARLARHDAGLLLAFRFLYGLRAAVPLALGLGTTGHGRFLGFNAAGAALWVAAFGVPGYLFGSAAEALVTRVRRFDLTAMGIIVAAGAVARLFYIGYRGARRRAQAP